MSARRIAAVVLVAALVWPLSACGLFDGGGGSTSSPQPSGSVSADGKPGNALPKPAAVLVIPNNADAQNDNEHYHPMDIVFAFYGIYRDGKYAKLLMGTWIQSGNDVPMSLDYQANLEDFLSFTHHFEPDDPSKYDATGLALVDTQARKAYLVARDAQLNGHCFCPTMVEASPALTTLFSMTFAAPPAGKKSMDVFSNMGYAQNVPVLGGPVPSPNPSNVPSGRDGIPTVYYETPNVDASTPVKAQIVDIDAPVSNLDLSVTEKKNKVVLAADVLFAFDKATLNAKGKERIGEAAAILKQKAHGTVQVNGYTDSKGSPSYNIGLSTRRAETVRKALAAKLAGTGIKLVSKGYGEAHPVAPNSLDGHDNPKGRALNRRVEIVYGK